MSYANNDERQADLDEKFQDRHDEKADRADEQRGSSFADSIFEFAKATNDAYRTAYEAGRASAWTELLVRATANMAKVPK